jgi:hypothetical protein
MRKFWLPLALAANTFAASPLIIGARGGATVTDNNNGLTSGFGVASPGRQYAIGPTIGVRLPLGFSVEGDALFNRQSFNLGQFGGFTAASTHTDSWEFPAMLKFTAGRHSLAPVFGAGVSFRHINNLGGLDFANVPSYLLTGSTSSNSVGFVASGGLRMKFGPVDVTPELRYTRWNSNNLVQSLVDTLTGTSRNETQVLIGLTF